MVRILFVCLGNICRSPMAEFVMKDMVKRKGTSDKFYIASAGTSDEEIRNGVGNPVYPPARQELARHGITDVSGKQATQLTRSDYNKYDLIIGMEQRNIHSMLRILGGDPDNKVKRLLDYSDAPRDISDPWYTHRFESAYSDILEGCEALYRSLEDSSLI